MADNILDSFLVSIGYKVDESSAKQAQAGLGKTKLATADLQKQIGALGQQMKALGESFVGLSGTPTQKIIDASERVRRVHFRLTDEIKTLRLTAVATTAAFVGGFTEIAKKYQELYYISQRTGTSAQALVSIGFGGQQIGKTAESMEQLVNSMSLAMRLNPGLQPLWRSLSGGNQISNPNASPVAQIKELHNLLTNLSKMPTYLSTRYMSMFNWDPQTTIDLIRNREVMYQQALKQAQLDQQAGIDRKKLLQDSVGLMQQWNALWASWGRTFDQAYAEVGPGLSWILQHLTAINDQMNEFNKTHPGAATAETGAVLAGGGLAGAKLVTGLGRTIFGSGAATAGEAAASPVTETVSETALGLGLRMLTGTAAGAYAFFRPTPAGSPHELEAEKKLRDQALAARAHDAPHFQAGGVVPINAHPGEVVLPSRLAENLTQWLRGSSGFRPFVQIDTEALQRGFSSGSGIGLGFPPISGGMAAGGAIPAAIRAITGKTGPQAATIAAAAKAQGASPAAITAMLAAGMGEGGLSQTWKPGDSGTSFGTWQLHWGGELNRYLKEGNKPGSEADQIKYVLERTDEIAKSLGYADFRHIRDPRLATYIMSRFERSKQPFAYYDAYIPAAQHALAQIDSTRLGSGDIHHHHGPVTAHQTNNFNLAAGGAVAGTIHTILAGAHDRLAATIVRNSRSVLN